VTPSVAAPGVTHPSDATALTELDPTPNDVYGQRLDLTQMVWRR